MGRSIKTSIGKPEQWLIEAAASAGLNLTDFKHQTTDDFKRHVIKRHGNTATQGRATIMDADFLRISDIVKAPNTAIIGAVRKGRVFNIYAKVEADITYIYFEQILDSHRYRVLRSSTFYKVTRPLDINDIKRIVIWNNRTDITKAVIVSPVKI